MHPQKREMYVPFIVTLENVESCIYAKKKFYFHVQVNSIIFWGYIKLLDRYAYS